MAAFCAENEEPVIILKDKKKFPAAKPVLWIEASDVQALYDKPNGLISYKTV